MINRQSMKSFKKFKTNALHNGNGFGLSLKTLLAIQDYLSKNFVKLDKSFRFDLINLKVLLNSLDKDKTIKSVLENNGAILSHRKVDNEYYPLVPSNILFFKSQ